jgi:hypothetical protein
LEFAANDVTPPQVMEGIIARIEGRVGPANG